MIYGCGSYGCFYTPPEVWAYRAGKERELQKTLRECKKNDQYRIKHNLPTVPNQPELKAKLGCIALLVYGLPIAILLGIGLLFVL